MYEEIKDRQVAMELVRYKDHQLAALYLKNRGYPLFMAIKILFHDISYSQTLSK